MKNLLIQSGKLMVTGVMSVALVMGSCAKEEVAQTVSNNDRGVASIETIQNMSTDYINNQRGGATFDRKLNWWKIAGKDLMGAAGGAIVGSVVGAVLGGVGASLYEAGSQMVAGPVITGGAGNPANEFDYVGESHVAILAAGLGDDRDLIFDGAELLQEEFLTYGKSYLIDHDIFTAEEMEFYNVGMLAEDLDFANTYGDESMITAITYLRDVGSLSDVEADILIPYYEAYEATTNYAEFHAFSVDSENIVMDDPSLSDDSKEMILSNMATTRHDLNYWNEFE
jgi:hypothetical protein